MLIVYKVDYPKAHRYLSSFSADLSIFQKIEALWVAIVTWIERIKSKTYIITEENSVRDGFK